MKKCIHCCRPLNKKTKDHDFPRTWYPDNTPASVQRWTVPSCLDCNNKLGVIEENLFVKLGICISPAKAEASGISRRALEALGIGGINVNEKEIMHRVALRNKILKEVIPYKKGMQPFPGTEHNLDLQGDQPIAVLISEKDLLDVSKKVLRGCEFKISRRIIKYPYSLEIYFPNEAIVKFVSQLFEKIPQEIYLGPGFEVKRGVSDKDAAEVLYRIVIWNQYIIYGAIGTVAYFNLLSTT